MSDCLKELSTRRARPLISGTGMSVIICCHNGKSRIGATLEALAKCSATFPVEILLVDNGSNDGTSEIAAAAWKQLGAPMTLRVVPEPKLGLAYARKRGVVEAAHKLIVFCDDDNWLSTDYLDIAAEVLSDPEVGAVSGQAEPVFEGPAHPFVYSHGKALALGIQALSTSDVTKSNRYVWGAGLAAKRSDLLTVYNCPGLPTQIGRSGELSVGAGDDNELCWALTVLGKKLIYDERLTLRHFMPRERLQLSYLLKRATHANSTWDRGIERFTDDLERLASGSGRVKLAATSALRWLRHCRWPEERRHQACLFLAACGWVARMNGLEQRIYIAFQWLRSTRQSGSAVSSGA